MVRAWSAHGQAADADRFVTLLARVPVSSDAAEGFVMRHGAEVSLWSLGSVAYQQGPNRRLARRWLERLRAERPAQPVGAVSMARDLRGRLSWASRPDDGVSGRPAGKKDRKSEVAASD
jgi:hypothetical protein